MQQITHLMSRVILFPAAGMIGWRTSFFDALCLDLLPQTKHFSIWTWYWWMKRKERVKVIHLERDMFSAFHSLLITNVWASEREFQRIWLPLLNFMKERRKELSYHSKLRLLSTKVSTFTKCTSSLMYCQLHTFLSLSFCRVENHIWSNLITELGHDLRNVPHTTAGTHTRTQTCRNCLCQLSPWPASSSTDAN